MIMNRTHVGRSAAIAQRNRLRAHVSKFPTYTFARWIALPVPRTSAYPCACLCGTARARLRSTSRWMINVSTEHGVGACMSGGGPSASQGRRVEEFWESVVRYRLIISICIECIRGDMTIPTTYHAKQSMLSLALSLAQGAPCPPRACSSSHSPTATSLPPCYLAQPRWRTAIDTSPQPAAALIFELSCLGCIA